MHARASIEILNEWKYYTTTANGYNSYATLAGEEEVGTVETTKHFKIS